MPKKAAEPTHSKGEADHTFTVLSRVLSQLCLELCLQPLVPRDHNTEDVLQAILGNQHVGK